MSREFFKIPDICPVCSGPTSIDGDFLFCRSKSCSAKLSGSVKVWVQKLGLLQWGDSFIESLCDSDILKIECIADLYHLSIDDMAGCCSGVKFATKCYDVLHRNKDISLELFLSALNISNLGLSTATDIVQSGFGSINSILEARPEDFTRVPNIGQITANQIFEGLQYHKASILKLVDVINIIKSGSGSLNKLSFCITGPTSKPRKIIQKSILDFGGIVKESVVPDLSYLVTNEITPTTKFQKANKLGIKIISEQDLYDLMKASSP